MVVLSIVQNLSYDYYTIGAVSPAIDLTEYLIYTKIRIREPDRGRFVQIYGLDGGGNGRKNTKEVWMMELDVMELLRGRRTYRRFEQKAVPGDVVEDIIEAARLANCGANKQALRYLIVDEPEEVDQVFPLVKWAAALPPQQGVPKPGERPPLYIAVIKDAKDGGFTDVDAGLAVGNMTLAAWAKGVGSCIMGAINRPKLAELFGLDESKMVFMIVALGYPSHKSKIVPVKDGSVKYYLDEKGDYCVPKYTAQEIASYQKGH